ncbi:MULTISPECIES: DUF5672 family protein [unclassified Sphingobium]|uniref:DUF5672 family protein n=1 Tax=unclassified Sphingobium TaxID=2611147 RepID=UPI000D15C0B8|nr:MULTISPECIES: DUF5672 family protein [unclassified Sphingobium]PSO09720.1 hypothetical protein C7E20_21075 [Sphingobium sp. AEW4]TWD19043.1 hypothetical protein FB596_12231 [Sphingobium sp. AEW013]
MDRPLHPPLALPQVTLCAVSSVNVTATLRALEASLAQIDVAACKFFTDAQLPDGYHPAITIVPIAPIRSSQAYSDFLLSQMVDHVDTTHCLIAQWDGHVLDAARWRADFLNYDYIGASWPQFDDNHDVGNGGFSLRSRRLMEACRHSAFRPGHPEDVAIGRINREWLESLGMRFAPRELADIFSAERAGDVSCSFGYHGAWLMPQALGVADFWDIYRDLDDRGTIRHDLFLILKQISSGRGWMTRALRLLLDQISPREGR